MKYLLAIVVFGMLAASAAACDGLSVLSQRACVQSYSAAVVAPVVQYQAPLAVQYVAPVVQYQAPVVLQQQAVVYQQRAVVQKVVQRPVIVRQRIVQRAPILRSRVKVVQSY